MLPLMWKVGKVEEFELSQCLIHEWWEKGTIRLTLGSTVMQSLCCLVTV